jgi:hypothetical protein
VACRFHAMQISTGRLAPSSIDHCTCLAPVMLTARRALQFGHLKSGFHIRPGGTRDSSPAIYRRVGPP